MGKPIVFCVLLFAACILARPAFAEDNNDEWRALQGRIDRLIIQLDKPGESSVIAMKQLVQIGEPAVMKLIAATSSPKPNRRMLSVTALGKIGDRRALGRIRFLGENDGFPPSRIAAVKALYAFGDNSGGKNILGYITHSSVTVRRYAVVTLGLIKYTQAIEVLKKRITYDEDKPETAENLERHPGVVCDIAASLKKLGDDTGLPLLVKLSRHKSGDIRLLAVRALTFFDNDNAIISLAVALTDPEEKIADFAFEYLFKNRKKAIEVIERTIVELTDAESLKVVLKNALQELGGKVSKPKETKKPPVVSEKPKPTPTPIPQVGETPEDKAKVDKLLPLLRSIKDADRQKASDELLKLGSYAVPCLIELLSSEPVEVKLRIIGILALIKDVRSLRHFRKMLKDSSLPVRCRSAWALGEMPTKSSVPFLIAALSDKESNMRFFAINSLQKLTGLRLGFEPRGSEKNRKRSISAWKKWWEENKNSNNA